MPDKDPLSYTALEYGWVLFLACWGGCVNFWQRLKEGKTRAFKIVELMGEIFTSGFVGVLTFLICESTETDRLVSAVLVGISGHMGAKTIRFFEVFFETKFGAK